MFKFGLFEKHTKFEKIFLMVLTNQLIYLSSKRQNHKEDFFKLCVLLKKSELYWFRLPSLSFNNCLTPFIVFYNRKWPIWIGLMPGFKSLSRN